MRLFQHTLSNMNKCVAFIMDRSIEIFRIIVFVTIWIIGSGVAVMFVLLSFHGDTFFRQVMINLKALGFLIFSYFCHEVLNLILAKREDK